MTVLELTAQLRDCVQHHFSRLRLQAEVGSFKSTKSGHCYLTLKGEDASIDAMIWANDARSMSYIPKMGDEVIVSGGLGTRPRSGQTTFYIKHIVPTGAGLMQAEFEQTCREFQAQGLFDRTRPLPAIPRGVGLITSVGSSAYHDFMKSVNERAPGIPIYIADVMVQGAECLPTVTSALRQMYQDSRVEVIALTRGGGSMEQLWDFNHRELCLFLARSPKPTVVGIGHEDNTLIAELVADVRGHTPTKVAESIFPHVAELHRRLSSLSRHLNSAISQIGMQRFNRLHSLAQALRPLGSMETRRHRLDELFHSLERATDRRIQSALHRLEALDHRLHRASPQMRVEQAKHRLAQLLEDLSRHHPPQVPSQRLDHSVKELNDIMESVLDRQRHRFHTLIAQLEVLSPLQTLGRGYSLVKRADGEVLQSSQAVNIGDKLHISLRQGSLEATVSSVVPHDSTAELTNPADER